MIKIVYSSWLCEYMLHMLLTPDGPDLLILLQSLGKTKKLIEAESICKSTIFWQLFDNQAYTHQI